MGSVFNGLLVIGSNDKFEAHSAKLPARSWKKKWCGSGCLCFLEEADCSYCEEGPLGVRVAMAQPESNIVSVT